MAEGGEHPGELNISLVQGEEFLHYVNVVGGVPEAEIDTAGYTAQMMVRSIADATAVLIELSSANGRIVLGLSGDPGGLGWTKYFTIGIDEADTAALDAGHYGYDLFLTPGGGGAFPLLAGRFVVQRAFTR